MADKFLTLLDLTKLSGTDEAVGTIEEVNTYAPEIGALSGRVINGITYTTRVRSALPGKPTFRGSNEGTEFVASTYEQKLAQCYYMDTQMRVDEKDVLTQLAEGRSMPDILTLEANGAVQSAFIGLGDMLYRGKTVDANGFDGLMSLYDTTNCEVDAQGTTSGRRSRVWIVYNDPQGVHFVWGYGQGFSMNPWQRTDTVDANDKHYYAYRTNGTAWIGLGFNHTKSVVCIKNVESGKFSDDVVSEALTKFPLFMRSSGKLKIFMNRYAARHLQKSRSTVNTAGDKKTDSGVLVYAPTPTESNGVPIIITDSILNTE